MFGIIVFVIILIVAFPFLLAIAMWSSQKTSSEKRKELEIAESKERDIERAREKEQRRAEAVKYLTEATGADAASVERAIEESSLIHDAKTFSVVPEYVAYDLETTGLSSSADSIIEIGAVKVSNGFIVDTFQELINPERRIPEKASAVNNITDDMVKDCRTIAEVFPDFKKFVGKLPLVAHNADFDYGFLKAANQALYGKDFSRRHYCTMKLYKRNHEGERRSARLSAMADNIVFDKQILAEYRDNSHRALTDAKVVYLSFELLKRHYIPPSRH